MEENFELIFSEINQDVKRMLSSGACGEKDGSGSIPFKMHLDGNGNGSYEIKQHGWGVTISASAIISAPNGVFDLEVKSSDGGGGKWANIRTGESLSCKIKTSFWHDTKIQVFVHSSVPNCIFEARLDYKY